MNDFITTLKSFHCEINVPEDILNNNCGKVLLIYIVLNTRKTCYFSTKDKINDVDSQGKVHRNYHNTWLMVKSNH